MVDLSHETTINARVSDVYDAVIDFEARDAWHPDIISIGLTAGNPIRTGTMIAMTKKFMGGTVFVNADVIELKRNKSLELKGMHGRFPYRRSIEFIPSGGSTTIQDLIRVDVGWLWFWYRPFLENALKSQQKREWDALANHLNQR